MQLYMGEIIVMCQAFRFKLYLIGIFVAVYLLVCFVFPRQTLSMMVIGNTQAEAILDAGEAYMRLMGFMGIPFCISVVRPPLCARLARYGHH